MDKIKVAIYEDNTRFREGLEMVLNISDKCELSGSYQNANDIQNDLARINPDVLLMDIQMPGINGIEAIKMLRTYDQQINIIILTVFDTNELVFDALRAGANGYILKNTNIGSIIDSIIDVYNGGAPMSATIARKVLSHFAESKNTTPQRDYNLSTREKEILTLLTKGYSYKMIASECFISIDTVRSHIRKIYEKLHVNSSLEAVRIAREDGIV